MTKEQALLIVEEKRSWADLISGEKDELYDAIDVVLAEIERLKGEVERLKRLNTSLVYGHDIFKLAALRVESTLRARLDALVTAAILAARVLENISDAKVPEWDDWETAVRDSYPAYIKDIRNQAKQGLDALAAAVEQAKGEVGG